MKNYWSNLSDRERWLSGLAACCSLIYFGYLLIFAPLYSSKQNKTVQLTEKINTLQWMQQAKAQKKTLVSRKVVSNSQLLSLLTNTLKTSHLEKFPSKIQQTGNGDIQLTFNEIPFRLFLIWLEELNGKYLISIKQLTASQSEKKGIVSLQLIITPVKSS